MTRRPAVLSGLTMLATATLLSGGCAGCAGGGRQGRTTAAAAAGPLAAATRVARPRDTGRAAGMATGPGTPLSPASPVPGPAAQRAPRQLITVTAPAYGATYATLAGYQRAQGRWRRVLGPWTARIGRNGFAPPGRKREGDGRTPSGSFGIQFLFGVLPNPGVRFTYRRVHTYDFWDDDPASPLYNEWVDTRYAHPGSSPEPMDVSGYGYGAAIAYNTARTTGLGSAIFLHLNIGIATAGCVTLPRRKLVALLRWLDPARSPRIEMGVR